jgi:hypothetical protein
MQAQDGLVRVQDNRYGVECHGGFEVVCFIHQT